MMKRLLGTSMILALLLAVAVPVARGAVGPLVDVKATWSDTNLPPGGEGVFSLRLRNIGDQDFSAPITLTEVLPAGVTATEVRSRAIKVNGTFPGGTKEVEIDLAEFCDGEGTATVTCTIPMQTSVEADSEVGTAPVLSVLGKAPGLKRDGGGPFQDVGFSPEPTGWLPAIYIDVGISAGASGTSPNLATLEGGGSTLTASDLDTVAFNPVNLGFGFVPGAFEADVFDAAYPFGTPSRQAGARPFEQRLNFDLNAHTYEGTTGVESVGNASKGNGLVRIVESTLPRGMIGNPEATPKCDPVLFAQEGATKNSTRCPSNTQVGYLSVLLGFPGEKGQLSRIPVYNIEPPKGTPVDLGFVGGSFVQGHVYAALDPSEDYVIRAVTSEIGQLVSVLGSELTLWGVPGDPAHDKFRFYPAEQGNGDVAGAPFEDAPIRPFFTNPMDCGVENGTTSIRADSYEHPGVFTAPEEAAEPLNVEGCDDPRFSFEPEIELQGASQQAGGPTGLEVNLKVPQRNDEVEDATDLYVDSGEDVAIGTPPIKKAVVTLPEGMTVSPSAAQGLGSCSSEQIDLESDASPTCPDSSVLGSITLHTPILPASQPAKGRIYIAEQNDNPFNSFLSLYLVVDEPDRGILVKLAGRVDLNPATGQISTVFDDLPQLQVSETQVNLKSGVRAGLVSPPTCGSQTITATVYSWHDPENPHTATDSYEVTQGAEGGPCVFSNDQRPFDPLFQAGTLSPLAGAFSPLEARIARSDADQELAAFTGKAPPGLVASLRGLGRCSDAQIGLAAMPGRSGTAEQAAPSCPPQSQIGTVDAGAGVGQALTYVQGKVYLAGPYKGAQLSAVAIVPAVAGPFDLGVVVNRVPIQINPRTALIRLESDPFPRIFKGVPVRARDIRVHVDRPGFTINPTSCEPMSIGADIFSFEGKAKAASSPFQATSCASLGFAPRLSLELRNGTKRLAYPSLRAVLRPRPGDANISSASVKLPPTALLENAHIGTVCTRVQFAARACPAKSIYGVASAISPLLDAPLSGPVFLRSSDNLLPDIVLDLRGEIDVEAVGRIDAVEGRIRSTFDIVPDAPISEVILQMQGGEKGLIINSRNLCKGRPPRAKATFRAHNGDALTSRPKVKVDCGKRKKKKRR